MPLNRRDFIRGLFVCLTAIHFPPLIFAQQTQSLILRRGFLTETNVQRVLSAGFVSDVMLMALCPEKLVGIATRLQTKHHYLSAQIKQLPYVGRIAGRGSTAPIEKIVALDADLILDVGDVNPSFITTADKIVQQVHKPYFIVSGKLAHSAEQFRQLGELLHKPERAAQLAALAQQILDLTHRACETKHLTVYLARSADGLETALKGAIHTEVFDWLGLRNAAEMAGEKRMARVSMENLLQWQPDVIVTHDENFFQKAKKESLWANLSAVKNKQIFLAPNAPFGWLDAPPSVNRLLGCLWLTHLFAPEKLPQAQFYQLITTYFEQFYGYSLSVTELTALVEQS